MGVLQAVQRLAADTVIMNPPFGTRRRGADLDFLRAAFQVHRLQGRYMHAALHRGISSLILVLLGFPFDPF